MFLTAIVQLSVLLNDTLITLCEMSTYVTRQGAPMKFLGYEEVTTIRNVQNI